MNSVQVKWAPNQADPRQGSMAPSAPPGGLATGAAQYPAPEPYPPVRVNAPNYHYAGLVADAAFGRESELTAINEYIYYAVMTDNPDLKTMYLAFARDEMNHLHILMQLIRALGRDPRAWDGNFAYWCGSYPYHGATDCDRLSKVHEDELAAAASYRRLSGAFGDPNLKAILERIAKDEDQHARLSGEWMKRTCGYSPGR